MRDGRAPPAAKPKKEDVVLLCSAAEPGDGVRVLRKRDAALEVGELRPMREGKPITGEVVKLTRREEHERLFDVEVLAAVPAPASGERAAHGPAQVATDAYRDNWEITFGKGQRRSAPN